MSMEEILNRLAQATEALTKDSSNESVNMTPEDFLSYAVEQMEKAASDPLEVRELRLTSLRENVIEVQKNFEGMNKTPGGVLAVKQFRDPGRVKTTSKTVSPTTPPVGQANFASNPEAPSVNGAGKAPTGKLVPSLQAATATSNFAKAMSDLTALLKGEKSVENAPSNVENTSQTAGTSEGDPQPVSKSEGLGGKGESKADELNKAMWPLDMNTPFGRGETEDDVIPEWGMDYPVTGETLHPTK